MNVISFLIDFVLHMDHYLGQIVSDTGMWTYVILFVVIFIETGLVVTPFLPGDSILFAAGALIAAQHVLDIKVLYLLMVLAAVLGDTANYWIGHYIGPKVFSRRKPLPQKRVPGPHSRILRKTRRQNHLAGRVSSPSFVPLPHSWLASAA